MRGQYMMKTMGTDKNFCRWVIWGQCSNIAFAFPSQNGYISFTELEERNRIKDKSAFDQHIFKCLIYNRTHPIHPLTDKTRLFETIIYCFFHKNVIFYFTKRSKLGENNQICWITKVSTHSKTLSHFCWKVIHFKAV